MSVSLYLHHILQHYSNYVSTILSGFEANFRHFLQSPKNSSRLDFRDYPENL